MPSNNKIEIVLSLAAKGFEAGAAQSRRNFGETMVQMASSATANALKISQALSNIEAFKDLQQKIAATKGALQSAATEAQRLGASYQKALSLGSDAGAKDFQKELKRNFDTASASVSKLTRELAQQQSSMQNLTTRLAEAGVNTAYLDAGQKRLQSGLQAATREATVQTQVVRSFGALGVRSTNDVQVEIAKLQGAYRELASSGRVSSTDLARAAQQVQKRMQDLHGELRLFPEDFRAMGSGAAALGSIIAAAGIGAMGKSIVETAISMEAIRTTLKAVSGSSAEAAKEFKFVTDESERLGLKLNVTAKSYAQIAAAAKGTSLEGKKIHDVFSAVAEASSALSLSGEDVKGVLLALSQMISKGSVQSEELRGQLGERLPGAFQIAARAMGVTTEKLGKMLEQGTVASNVFLPLFAAELRKTFGSALPDAVNSARAALQRLENHWQQAKDSFATSGFLDGVASGAKAMTAALSDPAAQASLKSYGSSIGSLIKQGIEHADIIESLIVAYAAYRGAILLTTGVQAAMTVGTKALALANLELGVAFRMHPLGFIATALGLVAGAAMYLTSSTKSATTATSTMTAGLKASSQAATESAQKIQELTQKRELYAGNITALEKQLAAEEKHLQQETLQAKLSAAERAVNATEQSIQRSLEAEKRLYHEIVALEEQKRAARMTTEEKVRSLLERHMTDQQRDYSRAMDGYTRLMQARQILAQKKLTPEDAKWAEELAKKAQDAYASIGHTNSTIRDTQFAIDGVRAAGETLEAVYQKQAIAAAQSLVKQSDGTKSLQQSMVSATTQVSSLKRDLDAINDHTIKRLELKAEVSQAMTKLAAVNRELAALRDKTVTVSVQHVEAKALGGVVGYARGGQLPGYGGGDSVHAMLEPGEIVIRKERASLFQNALLAINSAPLDAIKNHLPKFAQGGLVAVPSMPIVPVLKFATGGRVPETVMPGGMHPSEVVQIHLSIQGAPPVALFGSRDRVRQLRDDMAALQRGR